MTDLGLKLSKADSNHHKQNQNLLCYHYTIGQSRVQRYAFFAPAQNFMVLFLLLLSAKTPKSINIPPEVLLIGTSGLFFKK